MTTTVSPFNVVFKIDDTGGTPQDISAQVSEVTPSWDMDLESVEALGTQSKQYAAIQDDGTISVKGYWSAAIDGYIGSPTNWRTSRSIELGPDGSTSGKVKVTCEVMIKSYKPPVAASKLNEFTLELQKTGALTVGTYT